MTRKSPARQRQDSQVVTTSQTVTHYEGLIPHPDILQGFDNIVPGAAAELIKLAVDESSHRRQLENTTLELIYPPNKAK